jgi:hypothetical protein
VWKVRVPPCSSTRGYTPLSSSVFCFIFFLPLNTTPALSRRTEEKSHTSRSSTPPPFCRTDFPLHLSSTVSLIEEGVLAYICVVSPTFPQPGIFFTLSVVFLTLITQRAFTTLRLCSSGKAPSLLLLLLFSSCLVISGVVPVADVPIVGVCASVPAHT